MRKQFKSCPDCGAHLDPGETCECTKKAPSAATLRASSARAGNNDTQIIPQEAEAVKPRLCLMDLDDIQFRMKCAIDLVDAVHEAMENGSCAAECYTDALFGARNYLCLINDELRLCIEDMFEARKRGATA